MEMRKSERGMWNREGKKEIRICRAVVLSLSKDECGTRSKTALGVSSPARGGAMEDK